MVKIGIIGEHPMNDSQAIVNLLERSEKFKDKDIRFKVLGKKIRGSQWESSNAQRLLRAEFQKENPNFVIFTKDLDGLPSEQSIIKEKQDWFNKLDKGACNGDGIFFLAIFEMESIILADMGNFNKTFKSSKKKFTKNPMFQKNPKEWLIDATRKSKKIYKESECAELFKLLDLDIIMQNHLGKYSFKEFIENLEKKI